MSDFDKYKEAVKHAFTGKYGKDFDEFLRMVCEVDNFGLKSSCENMFFVEGKRFIYQALKRLMEEEHGR